MAVSEANIIRSSAGTFFFFLNFSVSRLWEMNACCLKAIKSMSPGYNSSNRFRQLKIWVIWWVAFKFILNNLNFYWHLFLRKKTSKSNHKMCLEVIIVSEDACRVYRDWISGTSCSNEREWDVAGPQANYLSSSQSQPSRTAVTCSSLCLNEQLITNKHIPSGIY